MLRKSAATVALFGLCLLVLQCGTGGDPIEVPVDVPDVADVGPGLTDSVVGEGILRGVDAGDQLAPDNEWRGPDACQPQCEGKECGDNGCEGSCGECEDCNDCVDGLCVCLCPPSECTVGQIKCQYANTKVRTCLPYENCPGTGYWSELEDCPELTKCEAGSGCVCKFGGCTAEDELGEVCAGKPLEPCEQWTCVEECCDTKFECPADWGNECCPYSGCNGCKDCLEISSGTSVLCPDGAPEGFIENKCTQDVCKQGWCEHFVKDGEYCDDGDPASIDSCDPEIGNCIHCFPDCDGKECGDDGCGGSCGQCPEGGVCCGGICPNCTCETMCNEWGCCEPTESGCTDDGEWICECQTPEQEECDGIDNDCDGLTDELSPDCDCDGVPDCVDIEADSGCSSASWVDGCCPNGCIGDGIPDEWDNCPTVKNPDQKDSDSDGFGDVCDDGCWLEDYQEWDDDCDGWPDQLDCIPYDPEIHPEAVELCDEIDNDCNGLVDDDCLCVPDCNGKECGNDGCGGTCGVCDDGDWCTKDWCNAGTGICQTEFVECNDNSLCTEDHCDPSTGMCIYKDVVCGCDPCDSCKCIPETGECVYVPPKCDDDDLCTDDYCEKWSGGCSHISVSCDDDDPCTDDDCNPQTGCSNTPKDCDDDELCTVDVCDPDTGLCIYELLSCDDNDICTKDLCDPQTGECVHPEDEDACDCPICFSCWCDPEQGCVELPKDCDDADACTEDLCNPATGGCYYEDLDCDDDNPCTEDACDHQTGCINAPKDCDDKNACTDGDYCDPVTGECVYIYCMCCGDSACLEEVGTEEDCYCLPVDCDDDNPCTDDSCDPVTGCINAPAEGAECTSDAHCNDGKACTDDICDTDGGCTCTWQDTDCDDDNPCTVDQCEPDGMCHHVPAPWAECSSATQCLDDGNACTESYCNLDAGCTCEHKAMNCSDGNPGTADGCDPSSGCTHAEIGCSDQPDPCFIDWYDPIKNVCYWQKVDCDDGNICTIDDCNSWNGCFHPLKCDDADPCTNDMCDPVSGECTYGSKCDDGEPSTVDTCDPNNGNCANVCLACDDGSLCTLEKQDPVTGDCIYTAKDCDDKYICTDDSCDPMVGCVNVKANCDDGNACTTDKCHWPDGCANLDWNDCIDYEPCTLDICDPLDGSCSYEVLPDGTECGVDAHWACVSGGCLCAPDCTGLVCGTDGCSGTCGDCPAGEYCESGQCLPDCGNGECDDGESCFSCAQDCGACPAGIEWLPIPGGEVQIGCSNGDAFCSDSEKPPHLVTVAAFELLETEVTESQFISWNGANPSCAAEGDSGPDHPVECVSWKTARDFCVWLGGRLPTEAEWELVARAGTNTTFPCGEAPSCLDSMAIYIANSGEQKQSVKSGGANAMGVYGMSGNVAEWVEDEWHYNYSGAPSVGYPAWDTGKSHLHVLRGGSYLSGAYQLRSSFRQSLFMTAVTPAVGLRCARSTDL